MKDMAVPELPVAILPDGRPVWASDLPRFGQRTQAFVGFLVVVGFLLLMCLAGSADIR